MKIVTWNVNSVRARLPHVEEFTFQVTIFMNSAHTLQLTPSLQQNNTSQSYAQKSHLSQAKDLSLN